MADNSIAALLANAGQTNADFNFGKIATAYWQGLDQAYKRRTQDAFLNDPSLLDDKGNLDPAKAAEKALRVGGVSAGEQAGKISDYGINAQQQNAVQDYIKRLNGGAASPDAKPPFPPSPNRDPASRTEPTPGRRSSFDSEQDPSQPQVVSTLPRGPGGFPPPPGTGPQASAQPATLVPPAPVPAQAPQAPLVPQTAQQAIAARFPQLAQPQPAPPPVPPQQAPLQPRVVQTEAIQPPMQAPQTAQQAIDQRFPMQAPGPQAPPVATTEQRLPFTPFATPSPQTMMLSPEARSAMAQARPQAQQGDQSLNGLISPELLRLGGGTAQGALAVLDRMALLAGPKFRSTFEAQAAAIREQLKFTNEQKNAQTPGSIANYERLKTGAVKDAETYAKKYESLVDAGTKAQVEIPQMQLLKEQMSDPNFFSGTGEKYSLLYKRLKSAVGIDPNAAVPQEYFRKAVAANVLSGLGALKGLGQIRNVEINLGKEAQAAPDNSVPANKLLVEIATRTHQRNAEIADKAEAYKQANGQLDVGFDRAITDYYKKHPLFSDAEIKNWHTIIGEPSKRQAAAPTATPQFSSPSDVQAAVKAGRLKRGDVFQDSNGKRRTVP